MSRVLLLEDSLTIIKVVRLTFASIPGFEVDIARSRDEATRKLKEKGYSAVLCYAQFCQGETVSFLAELSRSGQQILVYTESNGTVEEFSAIGLKYFLKKPFHSDDLRRIVGEMIDQAAELAQGSREFGGIEDEPTHAGAKRGKTGQSFGTGSAAVPPPPPPPPLRGTPVSAQPMPNKVSSTKTDDVPLISNEVVAASESGAKIRATPSVSNSGKQPSAPVDEITTRPAQDFASNSSTPVPSVSMDVESLEKKYRTSLSRKLNEIQTRPASSSSASESPVSASAPAGPVFRSAQSGPVGQVPQAHKGSKPKPSENRASAELSPDNSFASSQANTVFSPQSQYERTVLVSDALQNAQQSNASRPMSFVQAALAPSSVLAEDPVASPSRSLTSGKSSESQNLEKAFSNSELEEMLMPFLQKAIAEWLEKNAAKIVKETAKEVVREQIERLMGQVQRTG